MCKIKKNALEFSIIEWALLFNALTVIHIQLAPVGIIVLLLAVIYQVIQKKCSFQGNILNIFIICLPFIIFCFGFINTENFTKAFEDLGRLLPFIIFPFLLSFFITNKRFRNIFILVFCFGLLVFLFFNLIKSSIYFFQDGNLSHFFYNSLVVNTNSYSIINMFAIAALTEFFLKNDINKKQRILLQITLLFLVLIQLLLQSRIMILITLLSLFILFFLNWRNKKKWFILVLLVFSGIVFQIPIFQGRFKEGLKQSQIITNNPKEASKSRDSLKLIADCSSTSLRYNAIISCYEIILKQPVFGVGSGDWLNELTKNYQANKRFCNLKEKTAPHNQYLRILLKHGIVGFIFFLFYFFFLLRLSFKKQEIAQVSFILCLIFSSMGYDLMDGGATAPFVAFFASFLFLKTNEKTKFVLKDKQ
ncbi:MAG: hypothetical protein RL528_1506 [Bacteroidota bacterium]